MQYNFRRADLSFVTIDSPLCAPQKALVAFRATLLFTQVRGSISVLAFWRSFA